MLTSLKSWLEMTGYPVIEDAYQTPPGLPYIIFRDSSNHHGADAYNPLAERSIAIELYADKRNAVAEGLIEALLDAKAYAFTQHREWINSESFYMTVFEFQTTERK